MHADALVTVARERAGEGIAEREATRGDLVGEARVGVAVDLGLRIRRDRDRARRDAEVRAGVGDRVVVARGQGPLLDRVRPDVLSCDAGERAGEIVAADERA
jgi:hypothetical protein